MCQLTHATFPLPIIANAGDFKRLFNRTVGEIITNPGDYLLDNSYADGELAHISEDRSG